MIWLIVGALLALLITILILLKLYIKLTTGWDNSYTCLVGKTIIVTGANSGIGYVSAKEFAKRGARVVLACRNLQKANEARENIVSETNNENVVVRQLDLASFDSVRRFAEDVHKNEGRVDVLLNNAGIGLTNNITKDGFEETMQANYFSTFLLTVLLLDILKKSAPSRIVNVSSLSAAWSIFVNPDEINNYRNGPLVYGISKLCLIMSTQELSKKLNGTGISVFSLHPGVIKTKIYENFGPFLSKILNFFLNLFNKDVIEGAQTQIFVCAAKGLELYSGGHFEDCKKVADYRTTRNSEKRWRLWKNTVKWLDAHTDGEVSKILNSIESKSENDDVINIISSHI